MHPLLATTSRAAPELAMCVASERQEEEVARARAQERVQAEEFEKQVNELVATDPELADYVKQLKRRDFGQ